VHTLAENTFFSSGQKERNARCKNKDAVTRRLLDETVIPDPKSFRAVLMPSMYGPEVGMLRGYGVPIQNMFAVERDSVVHASYRTGHFKGIQTTPMPLAVVQAADYIPFAADLVYLDFFGQPDASHLEALRKLMRLGVVCSRTRLITTFGANRGDTFSCTVNRQLDGVVGECYVEAAASLAGLQVRSSSSEAYLTDTHIKFVVTVSEFL